MSASSRPHACPLPLPTLAPAVPFISASCVPQAFPPPVPSDMHANAESDERESRAAAVNPTPI